MNVLKDQEIDEILYPVNENLDAKIMLELAYSLEDISETLGGIYFSRGFL